MTTIPRRSRSRRVLHDRGMTLLELLVVMVILGLLATIGTVQVVGYLDRSRSDAAKLQMDQIATGLDLFRIDMGRLPTTDEGLDALIRAPSVDSARWRGPYLTKAASLRDPWGRNFLYAAPGQVASFDLSTLGADGLAGGSDVAADIVYERIRP